MIHINILTDFLLNAGHSEREVQKWVFNFVTDDKFQSDSTKDVYVHFKAWMGEYFYRFDPAQKRNAFNTNLKAFSLDPKNNH